MKGFIFEIKRFAVHDGDGIRTTVFLKGCPLKCVWCHNPEGIDFAPALAYYEHKCIGCGACASACPAGAHRMEDGKHVFDRALCTACGKCASVCLGSALTLYGREMTVEELLPLLLEDRDFYESSDGGVTLSGGECLAQADFCVALLKALKTEGIHTAVDTSGLASREALTRVMPYTDIFLYDLKAFDEQTHRACTGVSNRIILDNLRYLDQMGAKTEIRIPFVPALNADEMPKIADFLRSMKGVRAVRVLPYHSYAASKYAALDMPNTLPECIPTEEELEAARAYFSFLPIK